MFYPDSFPKHSIETLINILTMQGWTMHAIVWKIRVILLQIFVWIVDLKVREHLTEYLKKDIKYHQVIIEVLVWKRCCHKRFCWSKYLLWFYSAMYLISCVDDIMSESEKNANLFAFDERRYYWVMKSRYNECKRVNILVWLTSGECQSWTVFVHDIMSERESTCLHDWRTAKLLSDEITI